MAARRFEALVSVGSNVAPGRWIPFALAWLGRRVEVVGVSRWYAAAAVGGGSGTPDFINGALRLRTDLAAPALRALLRHGEWLAGRVRGADRFAPRTLDLDLMHWEPRVGAAGPGLVSGGGSLPPPDLLTEAYALVPCAEVWPTARVRGAAGTLAEEARRRFDGGGHGLRPCDLAAAP